MVETCKLAPRAGFEPAALRLTAVRSTGLSYLGVDAGTMAGCVSYEDRWLQATCRRIEEQVIEGAADRSFPSTLHVRRGGKLVAVITCPEPRVLVLRLARLAVAGLSADELVFLADAYGTRHPTNPEGEPWSVGEMQRRAQEPNVAAILYEAVQVYRVQRGAADTFRIVTYRVGKGHVEWGEPSEGRAFGLFARALRDAIEEPRLDPTKPASGFRPPPNMTAAEIRLEGDIATVRALYVVAAREGCTVGVGLAIPKDSRSQRRARRSFERVGLKCSFL